MNVIGVILLTVAIYTIQEDNPYYLSSSCVTKNRITDVAECQAACNILDIPISGKAFKQGRSCYRGRKNVCNQNGAHGRNSQLVCKHADSTETTTPTYQGGGTTVSDNDGAYYTLFRACPADTGVLYKDECAKACSYLGLPYSEKRFKDGRACYKNGKGVCNQNGASGSKAKMICKVVDGQWSDWSDYGNCSVTCGPGSQTRNRECDSPMPSAGGSNCSGESLQTKDCEDISCPDGQDGQCYEQHCGKTCMIRYNNYQPPNPNGICDGKGVCIESSDSPCDVYGCEGKNCGDDCLSGDIAGWCDNNGNCDIEGDNPDCDEEPTTSVPATTTGSGPCSHCFPGSSDNDGPCKIYSGNTAECVNQAETKYCSKDPTYYDKCVIECYTDDDCHGASDTCKSSICYCGSNDKCTERTDTCTAGQCKCGANDMCLWEWRVRNGKCSLGQCEDW